jgi:hypothetical protein
MGYRTAQKEDLSLAQQVTDLKEELGRSQRLLDRYQDEEAPRKAAGKAVLLQALPAATLFILSAIFWSYELTSSLGPIALVAGIVAAAVGILYRFALENVD